MSADNKSSDTTPAEESSENRKGKLTLEMIIRRPKFTKTEDARKRVNLIYSRQLGSYTVELIKVCPLKNRSIRIDSKKKVVSMVDMGTCTKFLDCFAPSITKLKIEYSDSEPELKHRAQLDRIVNKYCAEYLTDITFQRAPKDVMMKMKNPFSKVENVEFIDCHLTGKLTDFNYCFPKMKKLILLSDGKKIDGKCIAKHFPNLEHLGVNIKRKSMFGPERKEGYIEKKHVAEALQLNPNLRTLEAGYGWDTKFLKDVSKYLQFIEILHFKMLDDNLDSGTVHLKRVKKLFLKYSEMKNFLLSFDQLEDFSMERTSIETMNRAFIDFITKHSTISKLKISPILFFEVFGGAFINKENKQKLSKGLPSVTEINFEFKLSVDEAHSFLTECKSLKKIQFNMDGKDHYEALRNRISPEWNGTTENDFLAFSVTLERKSDQNPQSSETQ